MYENPSLRNWYLNHAIHLSCTQRFLNGFTTPELNVVHSAWNDCPYFEQHWFSMKFLDGYVNPLIRNMLDNGYYVLFGGVDDYYIEGKSWYHERHVNHNGMICGYDQEKKTYALYAYDKSWVYRKFVTTQKSFDRARISSEKQGYPGNVFGVKPRKDVIEFDPILVIQNIREYLDVAKSADVLASSEKVFGNEVHKYLSQYVNKLHEGTIPYDRMDRRIFRLIWEHKKVMLERMEKLEEQLGMDSGVVQEYKEIVDLANTLRMLYASHHLKRRDSVLPFLRDQLLVIKDKEATLLQELLAQTEKVI